MQSRMDKYQTKSEEKFERTKKNTKLYEEVYDDIYRDTTYRNMQVIDSAREININKLRNMIDEKYDTRQYRTFKNYDIEEVDLTKKPVINRNENKSYDINEIINEAKNKRAFIEEAREKKKYIDFTKSRKSKYDNLEEEEKDLEDLINTMVIPKVEDEDAGDALDLLSDLKGNENTIVTNPIEATFDTIDKEEIVTNTIEKNFGKADKTFYTDSNMFTKNDFEDFGTLTKELSRSNGKKKIFIIVLILIVLAACVYLLLTNYVFK